MGGLKKQLLEDLGMYLIPFRPSNLEESSPCQEYTLP